MNFINFIWIVSIRKENITILFMDWKIIVFVIMRLLKLWKLFEVYQSSFHMNSSQENFTWNSKIEVMKKIWG